MCSEKIVYYEHTILRLYLEYDKQTYLTFPDNKKGIGHENKSYLFKTQSGK